MVLGKTDKRRLKEEQLVAAAVQEERKAIAHIMRLLEDWGQLDIKGFPLVAAMVETLEQGLAVVPARPDTR